MDYSDPQQVVALARSYSASRSYRRAHELVTEALTHHPNDPALMTELARAEACLQQWVPAAAHAHAALSQQANSVEAMRVYALALEGLGRNSEAIWMAWRAVIAAPNEYLAHFTYARLLHRAGYHHQALLVVDEALRLQPNDPDTWALKGGILRGLQRTAESDSAYQEALRLQPDHAASINDMAINRLRQGRLTEALRGFLGAARVDPTLGELTRVNVTATLTRALRRVTWTATAVGLLIAMAEQEIVDRQSVAVPRAVGALAFLVLVACLAFVLRSVTVRVWRSTLEKKPLLVVRLVHATFAAFSAATIAICSGPNGFVAFSGPAVLLSGLFIALVGRSDKI